jgi:hypothetical protein
MEGTVMGGTRRIFGGALAAAAIFAGASAPTATARTPGGMPINATCSWWRVLDSVLTLWVGATASDFPAAVDELQYVYYRVENGERTFVADIWVPSNNTSVGRPVATWESGDLDADLNNAAAFAPTEMDIYVRRVLPTGDSIPIGRVISGIPCTKGVADL